MIYECPNCHVPQAAGRTSCHHCGAEFDGPVPADALVPEPAAAATSPADTAMLEPPVVQEVYTAPQISREPETPVYQSPPPYSSPPSYQPAPGYQQPAYVPPPPVAAGFRLPKALLIAIPIVLVLVLGAVFFANSLNQGGEASTPPPVTAPTVAEPAAPSPMPHGSPIVLSGSAGAAGSAGSNPSTAWLIGRWQSKSTDFYVFNENGTGYRGSISGKQEKESFLWVLVQKQLVLYADAEKPEKLAFSQGSDDATMYLRDMSGRYVQYARTKGES